MINIMIIVVTTITKMITRGFSLSWQGSQRRKSVRRQKYEYYLLLAVFDVNHVDRKPKTGKCKGKSGRLRRVAPRPFVRTAAAVMRPACIKYPLRKKGVLLSSRIMEFSHVLAGLHFFFVVPPSSSEKSGHMKNRLQFPQQWKSSFVSLYRGQIYIYVFVIDDERRSFLGFTKCSICR